MGDDEDEVPVRLDASYVESDRRGYQVVPARTGTALARFWHKTRAPSNPPRFPFCIDDVTKMVRGCVEFHGGVKFVVAYPPSLMGGGLEETGIPRAASREVHGCLFWPCAERVCKAPRYSRAHKNTISAARADG
jgi:hypothetical protein